MLKPDVRPGSPTEYHTSKLRIPDLYTTHMLIIKKKTCPDIAKIFHKWPTLNLNTSPQKKFGPQPASLEVDAANS